MSQFITFGELGTGTVHGASHKKHGQDCEDWSGAAYLPEIGAYAFTVADGHGDPSCIRSAQGAKCAVDLSLRWLSRLAKGVASPSNETQAAWRQELIEQRGEAPLLRNPARAIVRDWRQAVRADLESNPLTEDELNAMGERGRRWLEQDRAEMIYGATLLAGVLVQDLIVVLQQGDGCFGVMYDDARVEFPMPEDELCQGNVTTSLCDVNAARGMRFVVLNRAERDPVACFVCTDGVDKSLMQAGGLEDFFWEAVIGVLDQGDEPQARAWMRTLLDEVSEHGAGDDTSLAGYVDVERALPLQGLLVAKRDEFVQSENRRVKEQRVISMERRAAHNQYENEQIDLKISELRREREEGLRESDRRIQELEEQRARNEEYIRTYESLKREISGAGMQDVAPESPQVQGGQQVAVPIDEQQAMPYAQNTNVQPMASQLVAQEQTAVAHNASSAPTMQVGRTGARHVPLAPIIAGAVVVLLLVVGAVFLVPTFMVSRNAEPTQTSATSSAKTEDDAQAAQGESPEVLAVQEAVRSHLGDLGSESTYVSALLEAEQAQSFTDAYVAQNAAFGATEVPGLADLAAACLSSTTTEVGNVVVVGDSAVATVTFECGSATRSGQSGQTDIAQLLEDATQNVKDSQTRTTGNARVYLEKREGAWELCYAEGLMQEIARKAGFFEVCDTALGLLGGTTDAAVDADNEGNEWV